MKKKWLIIGLVVVVLAVVLTIVFINLFTPKNTTQLAQQLNSMTSTGYLSSENANNKKIDAFMEQVKNNANLTDVEQAQIQNYIDAYQAFELVGGFYNRQMLYTKHSSAYSNNISSIKNSLNNANGKAKTIASYIINRENVIGEGPGKDVYLVQTWRNCKANMKSLFDNTVNAFNRIATVYNSCVTSPLMNNDMSKAAFKVAKYYTDKINQELKSETKPSDLTGAKYLSFVKIYFTKENEYQIANFQYSILAPEVALEILEAKDLDKFSQSEQAWSWFVNGEVYSKLRSSIAANFDMGVVA